MPKVDIDYSNTLFYKISCKDAAITDVYIGHTTNFVQRKSGHKQSCNNPKSANHNFKLYSVIRERGGWDNWKMDIIAYHNCNDHYEARKIEQEYFISHNATLNSIEPMPKPKCVANQTVGDNDIKSKHLCDICKFSCFNTLDAFNIHLTRNRHIMAVNKLNKRSANNNCNTYECLVCDYTTNNKYDYQKHNKTIKHTDRMIAHAQQLQDNCAEQYVCGGCDKSYKTRSGLSYHKLRCSKINEDGSPVSSLNIDHPIAELLNQIKELKDVVAEQTKQIATQQCQTQLLLETIKNFISKP
jgi:hypothetical protein